MMIFIRINRLHQRHPYSIWSNRTQIKRMQRVNADQ